MDPGHLKTPDTHRAPIVGRTSDATSIILALAPLVVPQNAEPVKDCGRGGT